MKERRQESRLGTSTRRQGRRSGRFISTTARNWCLKGAVHESRKCCRRLCVEKPLPTARLGDLRAISPCSNRSTTSATCWWCAVEFDSTSHADRPKLSAATHCRTNNKMQKRFLRAGSVRSTAGAVTERHLHWRLTTVMAAQKAWRSCAVPQSQRFVWGRRSSRGERLLVSPLILG